MQYTIGEAAQHVGLSASTLRYYDREGLLPFLSRSAGGIRMFGQADLEWLALIECLKAAGMPIKEIRQFMDWFAEGDATLPQRRDMFLERRRAVQSQMDALQRTLDTLTYKCWFYETAAAAGTVAVHETIGPDGMPDDIRRYKENMVVKTAG